MHRFRVCPIPEEVVAVPSSERKAVGEPVLHDFQRLGPTTAVAPRRVTDDGEGAKARDSEAADDFRSNARIVGSLVHRLLERCGLRLAGFKNQIDEPQTGQPLFAHCLYHRPRDIQPG